MNDMEINWLLVAVAGIVLVCCYMGYRRGLVKMLLSVVTFLITVVLVRFLAPTGVQLIKANPVIYDGIKVPIEQMLDEKIDGKVRTEDVLDSCSLPDSVKKDILKAADGMGVSQFDVFTPQVRGVTAECITLKVIDLLAYVVLFLLINIGLRIIAFVLERFSRIPGIRRVNKLAGMGVGLLEGIVFVWLVFAIITIFPAADWAKWCFEMIADSRILSILYARNLFLVFV